MRYIIHQNNKINLWYKRTLKTKEYGLNKNFYSDGCIYVIRIFCQIMMYVIIDGNCFCVLFLVHYKWYNLLVKKIEGEKKMGWYLSCNFINFTVLSWIGPIKTKAEAQQLPRQEIFIWRVLISIDPFTKRYFLYSHPSICRGYSGWT